MNGLEKAFSVVEARKPSHLQDFFFICAGADREILCQCPTDWNKYAGIGATIVFTGLLASISGGYALFTVFRGVGYAVVLSIVFGLFWGCMIFNLDRLIVSSLKKEGDQRKEWLYAIPRFVLAIIISIVIAKPLEIRIFESRIEQQILEDKRAKLEAEKLSLDKLNDKTKLENTIQVQVNELGVLDSLRQGDPTSDDFQKLLEDRNIALGELNMVSRVNNPKIAQYNTRISEIRNNEGSYQILTDSLGNQISKKLLPAQSKEINELSYSRNLLQNEVTIKQKRVEDHDADIKKARDDYKALMVQRINEKEAEIIQTKGFKSKADSIFNFQYNESVAIKEKSYTNNFITQLEALGNLTGSNSTMFWTSWMIMLLFIVLEVSPILVKIMTKRGSYDEILERVEYETMISEKEIVSRLNIRINELLEKANEAAKLEGETFIQVEKQRLDLELRNNQRILDEIGQKQEHLAKIAIDKWYRDELAKNLRETSVANGGRLEGTFWRLKDSPEPIEYFFRNGCNKDNVLMHWVNQDITLGRWSYLGSEMEISLELANNLSYFDIEELGEKSLKLRKRGTKEVLEFESC